MTGLKYSKLDLHVHTPSSACYSNKEDKPEDIINKTLEQNLSGIAITDHNSAEGIDSIQKAAKEKDIVIFPGVEITLEAGYHIVALFDPSKTQKDIESLLGKLNILPEDYGKPNSFCKLSPHDVINLIHERGGLAILAHIDAPKGIYFEKTSIEEGKLKIPNTFSDFINNGDYDAVECQNNELPDGFNKKFNITRLPALYQASDNPDPEESLHHSCLGIGSRYSWFKLDEINLEGLRQCFTDPEVRIRLMDKCQEVKYPKILELDINGDGFFRNEKISLHEGLNSIIGGKGVGKSLIIEFLRFILHQPPSDEQLLNDHRGKLDKRLGLNNSISIIVETAEGTKYKITRTFLGINRDHTIQFSENCVNIDTGQQVEININELFPILAYSQTEVISISNDKNAQLKLIDRFLDPKPLEQNIESKQEELSKNDGLLSESVFARIRLDDVKKEIGTLEQRINEISKSLDNSLFQEMKNVEKITRFIKSSKEEIESNKTKFQQILREMEGNEILAIPDEIKENDEIKKVKSIVEQQIKDSLESLREIISSIDSKSNEIKPIEEKNKQVYESIQSRYLALLKTIGGNQQEKESERLSLETQKSELLREQENLTSKANDLGNLTNKRNDLLNELEEAYQNLYKARKEKYEQLTNLSNGKLKVEIAHASDFSNYEDCLVELLKGSSNSISVSDRRKIAQNIPPRNFITLILARDANSLSSISGVSEGCAQRILEKVWAVDDFQEILAIQHKYYPADTPSIRFRKGRNQYDELNEISIGQKCTSLLIIALCDGAMPVIIDQPEDALDIVSVWEDITDKIRKGKDKRQFILTTHNASVAVCGDSDQFIILESTATRGKISSKGAIDRKDVRDSVIQHMEGGEKPLSLKNQKYNI